MVHCVAVWCSDRHLILVNPYESRHKECVAVCCSVLRCVASVLQCLAVINVPFAWAIHTNQETKGVEIHRVCCSVLQCATVCCSVLQCVAVCCSVLQCVAVCCSVLQCVAVSCNDKRTFILGNSYKSRHKTKSVLQCGAVWCSVVQYGAAWCNVVQCGAITEVQPILLGVTFSKAVHIVRVFDIFESCLYCWILLKAQRPKLERILCHVSVKRDV